MNKLRLRIEHSNVILISPGLVPGCPIGDHHSEVLAAVYKILYLVPALTDTRRYVRVLDLKHIECPPLPEQASDLAGHTLDRY